MSALLFKLFGRSGEAVGTSEQLISETGDTFITEDGDNLFTEGT